MYVLCLAIPRPKAENVADFLIQEVFFRFRGVKEVISDRGFVFTSHLVRETVNALLF